MLGEPFAAAERKLDEARVITYFPASARQTHRACVYMEAGKPGKAADLFGTVLAGRGLACRDE
jgi:hypothetical protein